MYTYYFDILNYWISTEYYKIHNIKTIGILYFSSFKKLYIGIRYKSKN